MPTLNDRIERSALIAAPRSKVWHLLTTSAEFCAWFGVEVDRPLLAGSHVLARSTHPEYAHVAFDMFVEAVKPEHYFAWRWHPYALRPDYDYSKEPTTLVAFYLEETDGGTLVRVVETGFDDIPPERRAAALRANVNGWEEQFASFERHVVGR